jgi:hypothetical protein
LFQTHTFTLSLPRERTSTENLFGDETFGEFGCKLGMSNALVNNGVGDSSCLGDTILENLVGGGGARLPENWSTRKGGQREKLVNAEKWSTRKGGQRKSGQ